MIPAGAPNPALLAEADAYLQYVERLERAFEEATKRTGRFDFLYRIAGRALCVRLAGDALVPLLTPALEHAKMSAAGEPALTVCAWDPESTGVRLPNPPWNSAPQADRGKIVVRNWNGVDLAVLPDGEVNLLDHNRKIAFYCPSPALELNSSPFLTILHWWMRGEDIYCIHAGAVGFESGGVLLVGRGGSGKSTAALSCLQSSLGFVSDDYCLMSAGSVSRVYSLYSSGKLEPHQTAKLPFLLGPGGEQKYSFDKAVFFLSRSFSQKLVPGFPVRAVLVPKVTGRTATAATRIPAVEAMKALAPSTLFQLTGSGQPGLVAMATLVKSVPCYRLEVGIDLPTIPRAIEDILRAKQ